MWTTNKDTNQHMYWHIVYIASILQLPGQKSNISLYNCIILDSEWITNTKIRKKGDFYAKSDFD